MTGPDSREDRMQTRRTTQTRVGRIFALFLYVAGAGMLFPACNGSTGHTGTAPGGTIAGGTIAGPGGTTTSPGGTTTSPGGVTTAGGVITSGGVTSTGGITQASGAAGGNTGVTGSGHYQMENLDRGVVAVKVSGGVYVGWRMFGTEYDTTASNVSYNLYRDGTKVQNVTDSTNFLDAAGTSSSKYTVSAVIKGVEGAQSAPVTVWAQQYLSIPITPPSGSYSANDASTGDLDGDGKLDIVLKWDPSNSKDSGTSGTTDPCIIDGYTMAGKKLWSINVGTNIRAGAHDTQFSVYDFDGDGKAEVAFKTAPGTKDGKGNFLAKGPAAGADNTKDYRSTRGMVLDGPEWLTVFSGVDGSELDTVNYPVPYGPLANAVATWGDDQGNRSHRYNGGFAFVKDKASGVATGRPSIIQQRGYYTRLTVSAMNFRDGVLSTNWIYDSGSTAGTGAYGQGCHSCMAADVDGDGAQEIIPGSSTINGDGTFRCATGIGHGDALHVSELVVGKGISVFLPHEMAGGQDCHDASTCTLYFNMTGGGDNGRGVAEYVAATDLTAATCSSSRGKKNCGTGADVTSDAGSCFLIYWNAGELRSTMNGTGLPGVSTTGTSSCNGTKNTPTLTADLLGDWREEAVLRESTNTALRVYTTTVVTKRRIYTLMHDPTYRAQVSFEQSSYNQPPHVGFHIGQGMADPPKPDIYLR
jgi:rhamnogalacturonan endolyase